MKTNIFDVRFVNNTTDEVFHVTQYGKTAEEIKNYWCDYFKHGRKADIYSFIDAIIAKKDVEVSDHKFKKHLNMFDWNEMHGVS